MGAIGDWWVKSPDFHDDERVVESVRANHSQSIGRAVGGKLFVTDRRLVFVPHRVDAVLGGTPVRVDLDAIATVTTESRGGRGIVDTLFGGGLRERLRVETVDDAVELFVVSDLPAVVETIEDAIDAEP